MDLPLFSQLHLGQGVSPAPRELRRLLADVQGAPLAEGDLQLLCDGSRGHGRTGAWRGLGTGGEDFLFLCPNREEPLRKVLQVYERLLEEAGFDGVMLDRIRYPSTVNGFESLFGCFCPDCEREYAARTGTPLAEQRKAVAAFLDGLAGARWSQAAKWRSFSSLWKNAGLEELLDFKRRSITRVVRRFAGSARRRGLKVGLDLYSYSLAPLVAQDYGELSGACDWLKPMSYCHAVGPAGLPLELACLQEAFASLCPRLSAEEVHRLLVNLLGWRWPQPVERLLREGLGEQTLGVELERIASDPAAGAARVFAGFEAVRLPQFGVDITAEVLRRYLAQAAPRSAGLIASWNLPDIPEENLRVLGQRKRTA
jgi:hypothetical protein